MHPYQKLSVSDLALIREIKKHKCLFTRKFVGSTIREQTWKKVSETLNLDKAICQYRWGLLRRRYDNYAKKWKNVAEIPKDKAWHLYEPLSFLRNYTAEKDLLLDDLKFIDVIRQHDILWNTHNPQYNLRGRNLTWAKIAYMLGKPEEHCRNRWMAMRNKIRMKIKKDGPDLTGWPYAEPLKFLFPHLKLGVNPLEMKNKEVGDKSIEEGEDSLSNFEQPFIITDGDETSNSSFNTVQSSKTDPLVGHAANEDLYSDFKVETKCNIEEFMLEETHMGFADMIEEVTIEEEIQQKVDIRETEQQTSTKAEADNIQALHVNSFGTTPPESTLKWPLTESSTSTAASTPISSQQQQQQPIKKAKTNDCDPFYEAIGVYFENIDADHELEYKMDVLAYVHKKFNEFKEKKG